MGDTVECYLRLEKETFESVMKRANQESIDSDLDDETCKEDFLFPEARIMTDEFYIEEKSDVLVISGQLNSFGKELGFIDLKIPLSQEIAIGIIERYLKKMGQLKTVLEATK